MSTIHVINKLSLKNSTFWCNTRNGKKLQEAHKRQGNLDKTNDNKPASIIEAIAVMKK